MSDQYCQCNAPCIINVASGFYLVRCEQHAGHVPHEHSCILQDRFDDIVAIIEWHYAVSLSEDANGISYAPPLSERCTVQLESQRLMKLDCFGDRGGFYQPLLSLVRPDDHVTRLCCEEPPGHEQKHRRSGTFGPLGIEWRIIW